MRPNRRQVLAGLGAAALGCHGGRVDDTGDAADPRTPEPDPWPGLGAEDPLFPLGVQAGDPTPEGAVLWTRYDGDEALDLFVATHVGGAWQVREPVRVEPIDGFVHHDVGGIGPDTPVAFQFRDASGRCSAVGRLRTAIAADSTATVVLGATSCCNQRHGDFPSLVHLAARFRMDAFLWLGDTVYADAYGDRGNLDAFRAEWAFNLSTEGYRAILGSTASVHTWDDHEVSNNWNHETVDPNLLEMGRQAYFEHTAIRGGRIWRSLRFGRTAEVFTVDCRGERFPSQDRFISPEQMAFLKAGLSASSAVWKVIANPIPISVMPAFMAPVADDRWEGFPAQRDELLDHIIDEGITGVLFVSGDLHQSSLSRVDPSGPRDRILELQAGPSGAQFLTTPARLVARDHQWLWSDAQWCADVLELRSDGTARIVAVDEDDRILFDGVVTVDGELIEGGPTSP